MTLNTQQKQTAANELAKKIFRELNVTAHSDGDDLIATINSLDTAMAMIINTVPAAWETKTFKAALIDNLPEPFQSNSTATQKAMALALWAMAEAGII